LAGDSLVKIVENAFILKTFMLVSELADVVLACRVSPKQKADIVELIKKKYPKKITLSIGDGANDVSMLMKAHIGVGIAGREGMQAARASDYAIGKFKFLKTLMFVHGREAYRKNSAIICYSFYKNILYVVVQMHFNWFANFSGQPLYEAWIY
jgi:phospholipid-transporting ATPase